MLPDSGCLLLDVPDLMRAAMEKSSKAKFLIDGFPRELSQIDLFKKQVSQIVPGQV